MHVALILGEHASMYKLNGENKLKKETKNHLNVMKMALNEWKSAKTEARDNSKLECKYFVTNHIESIILKGYNISKSYYYAGDLEGNDVRRLMSKGPTAFDGTCTCVSGVMTDAFIVDE